MNRSESDAFRAGNPVMGCVGLVFITCVIAGLLEIRSCNDHARTAPLEPHIPEYFKQVARASSRASLFSRGGYIRGKLVVVDWEKKCIDPLQLDLDPALAAAHADTVATVAFVERSQRQIGFYVPVRDGSKPTIAFDNSPSQGIPAYAYTARLRVLDLQGPTTVLVTEFSSSDPSDLRDQKPPHSENDKAILACLKGLPRAAPNAAEVEQDIATLKNSWPLLKGPPKTDALLRIVEWEVLQGRITSAKHWINQADAEGVQIAFQSSAAVDLAFIVRQERQEASAKAEAEAAKKKADLAAHIAAEKENARLEAVRKEQARVAATIAERQVVAQIRNGAAILPVESAAVSDQSAAKYVRASHLNALVAPAESFSASLKWSAAKRRPVLGIRMGIGVTYSTKTGPPVTNLEQLEAITGVVGKRLMIELMLKANDGYFGSWPNKEDPQARGVFLMGSGDRVELKSRAKNQFCDVLITVDVALKKSLGQVAEKHIVIRFEAVDDERSTWSSSVLSNARAVAKPESIDTFVDDAVNQICDRFQLEELRVTTQTAQARVQFLTTSEEPRRLSEFLEVRWYVLKGLITQAQARAFYVHALGNDLGSRWPDISEAEYREALATALR